MSVVTAYVPIDLPSVPTRFETFGADEIPVPVESIAEDLRVEARDLGDCSGMLIPSECLIVVNAADATNGDVPTRRHRFTIAHELGHWILPRAPGRGRGAADLLPLARPRQDADRDLEREANVFGAELLMPEAAVREAWAALADTAEVAERFEVSALAVQWRPCTALGWSPNRQLAHGKRTEDCQRELHVNRSCGPHWRRRAPTTAAPCCVSPIGGEGDVGNLFD